MKKIIAAFLSLLVLTGCAAGAVGEVPGYQQISQEEAKKRMAESEN